MKKKRATLVSDQEAMKNLLIIFLLKEGVDPRAVSIATGIPEGTLRRKFQMKLIKNEGETNA